MCLALALVSGANASLAVALPDIAAALGASQTQLTWIVNAYGLLFAALLLAAGIAADKYGRRLALLLGLGVFGAASVASAWSDSPATLIALRAAAGLGAAAVFPATLSVLIDAFPPDRRAFAVSTWAAVSGAGGLAGLALGALLLENFWWGSVQLAFGAAALALVAPVAVLVPNLRNPALSLDPLGAMLVALGLGGLVYGVIEGPDLGWADPRTLTGLATGVAGLAAFTMHELRTRDPLLDVRLFRSPGLAIGSLLIFLQFFGTLAFFLLGPQYLQFVLGREPLGAVLALLPIAVGLGPTAPLAPALITRFGARWVGAAGMTLLAAAFVLLAVLAGTGRDQPWWQLAAVLVLFGFGFGIAMTPSTTLILEGLPADRRTLASAVNDVTREVGAVLGGSVLSTVLLAAYRVHLPPAPPELPAGAAAAAEAGIGAALGAAERLGPTGVALAEAAREAFTAGYSLALLTGAAVLLLGGALCALFAPPGAGRTAPRDPAV